MFTEYDEQSGRRAPGRYPVVMTHRTNYDQIAIGGVMIDEVREFDWVEQQLARRGDSGWRTRFDGGESRHPGRIGIVPVVAMYAEGLEVVVGEFGAYDSWVERDPQCYAVVYVRDSNGNEKFVYLKDRAYGFGSVILRDGHPDLKWAYDRALDPNCNHFEEYDKLVRKVYDLELDRLEQQAYLKALRSWRVVVKKRVPGRVRQYLHRTLETTRNTFESQFGQGADYFKLKRKK